MDWIIAALAWWVFVPSACELEDLKFCDFERGHCTFNYSNLRDGDHSSAFLEFMNKPLGSAPQNRGCSPRPSADRPFTVSIEPCFTDYATQMNDDDTACPDIPPEYYKANGRLVKGLVDLKMPKNESDPLDGEFTYVTVPMDLTDSSFISGDPVEFHILTVGRHYVYGRVPDPSAPFTGASNITYGLPLKDIRFRTLPLSSENFVKMQGDLGNSSRLVRPDGNQCPIEVSIGDDRTVDMTLKQQMENIYTTSSTYYSELSNGARRVGRGCYMCYRMRGDTYYDALKNYPNDWLKQYHPGCILTARDYAGAYNNSVDDENGDIFDRIKDYSFLRNVMAGVYTLYPYVEIPTGLGDADAKRLVDKQLRYILDPEYHVTVEIVGMRKAFGSVVMRNLHGNILEKNLVEFEPNLKTLETGLQEDTDSLDWTPPDNNNPLYYNALPNKCIISYANYSRPHLSGSGVVANPQLIVCNGFLDTIYVNESNTDPVRISMAPPPPPPPPGHLSAFVPTTPFNNFGAEIIKGLKTPFNQDYCFHDPGQAYFRLVYATSCFMIGPMATESFHTKRNIYFSVCDFEKYRNEYRTMVDSPSPSNFGNSQIEAMGFINDGQARGDAGKINLDDIGYGYDKNTGKTSPSDFVFTEKLISDFVKKEDNIPESLNKTMDWFAYWVNLNKNDPYAYVGQASGQCGSLRDIKKYYPNTWLLIGAEGPYLAKPTHQCPMKETHGQIRMLATVERAPNPPMQRGPCPPLNCGPVCVSRFTGTEYFFNYNASVPAFMANFSHLSIPVGVEDITRDFIDAVLAKNGPYSFFCNGVEVNEIDNEGDTNKNFCTADNLCIIASAAGLGTKTPATTCNISNVAETFRLNKELLTAFPGFIKYHLNNYFRYNLQKSDDNIENFNISDYPRIWECSPAYYFYMVLPQKLIYKKKLQYNQDNPSIADNIKNQYTQMWEMVSKNFIAQTENHEFCDSTADVKLFKDRVEIVDGLVMSTQLYFPHQSYVDQYGCNAKTTYPFGKDSCQRGSPSTKVTEYCKYANGKKSDHCYIQFIHEAFFHLYFKWQWRDDEKKEIIQGGTGGTSTVCGLRSGTVFQAEMTADSIDGQNSKDDAFFGCRDNTAKADKLFVPDGNNDKPWFNGQLFNYTSYKLDFTPDDETTSIWLTYAPDIRVHKNPYSWGMDLSYGHVAQSGINRAPYSIEMASRYILSGACRWQSENDLNNSNVQNLTSLACSNQAYTETFYGREFSKEEGHVTWNHLGMTNPTYKSNLTLEEVVKEANIVGVAIKSPVFFTTAASQFPGGVRINSTRSGIHTRMQRVLGETGSNLATINCNVVALSTPNVAIEGVELDNAGCQESAMQLAGGNDNTMLKNFKGWNFAALRMTKELEGTDPVNLSFVNIKFTSAVSFRRQFPGRPLVSVDNAVRQSEWVNVDGMYMSNVNDTFDYNVDVENAGAGGGAVQLAPLDMIMWNYKGEVDFGVFPDSWEVVSYAQGGAQNTAKNFYTAAANNIISFDPCPNNTTGLGTNASYCRDNGGEDCVYRGGRCMTNVTDTRDTLQILDGNDFFDLAADRYRCFDPLTVDCTTAMIIEAVTIVTIGVLAMVTVHTIFKSMQPYKREECLDILETKAEAYDDYTGIKPS